MLSVQARWYGIHTKSTAFNVDKLQGLGIALVAAQKAKVPVKLIDTSQASLDKGLKFAGENGSYALERLVLIDSNR